MKLHHLFILFISISYIYTQNTNTTTNNTTIVVNDTNQTSTVTVAPNWLNKSSTELNNFMIDKYNYFVTSNGNKVWVGTMNLAWNQMKRSILQTQNATFNNTNSLQDKLVSNLNSQLFTSKQLSDDSYYVSAGYGQSAVQKINVQVRDKFPNKMFSPLSYQLKDQDFISYAYLQKILRFQTPFSNQSTLTFKNVSCNAFSTTTSKQRKQLYYKYYNNSQQFLMGIQSMNPNDQILLFKTNRTQTKSFKIQKLLEIINLYDKLPNLSLKKYDSFKMPVLSFDYTRNYNEMVGLQFTNPDFQDYKITQMQQKLILNIDKQGVKAYSQAVIVAVRTMLPWDQKFFYLNNDFWLILKQKNKKPYLIMLVTSLKQTWQA